MNVTLSEEDYASLVSLARSGSDTPDKRRVLESFLRSIEEKSGIKRYALMVQWQELRADLPPKTSFPRNWPPEMRLTMEQLNVPISKKDVVDAVNKKAKSPTNILVTRDLGGVVGWMTLEEFFVT